MPGRVQSDKGGRLGTSSAARYSYLCLPTGLHVARRRRQRRRGNTTPLAAAAQGPLRCPRHMAAAKCNHSALLAQQQPQWARGRQVLLWWGAPAPTLVAALLPRSLAHCGEPRQGACGTSARCLVAKRHHSWRQQHAAPRPHTPRPPPPGSRVARFCGDAHRGERGRARVCRCQWTFIQLMWRLRERGAVGCAQFPPSRGCAIFAPAQPLFDHSQNIYVFRPPTQTLLKSTPAPTSARCRCGRGRRIPCADPTHPDDCPCATGGPRPPARRALAAPIAMHPLQAGPMEVREHLAGRARRGERRVREPALQIASKRGLLAPPPIVDLHPG